MNPSELVKLGFSAHLHPLALNLNKFSSRLLPSNPRYSLAEGLVVHGLFLLILSSLIYDAYWVDVGAVVFLYLAAATVVTLSHALALLVPFTR